MQENILESTIGAGCVVVQNKKVLLVQLNYGKFKGHWILPGGMVESGETPAQAAIRETFEETGQKVEIDHLLAIRYRELKDGTGNSYFVYFAMLHGGPASLVWPEEELLEARYWSLEEIENDDLVRPLTKKYIQMAMTEKVGLQKLEAPDTVLGQDELFGLT